MPECPFYGKPRRTLAYEQVRAVDAHTSCRNCVTTDTDEMKLAKRHGAKELPNDLFDVVRLELTAFLTANYLARFKLTRRLTNRRTCDNSII